MPLWIALYGTARFIVESMRTDEATLIAGIRINQWVSATAIIVGGLLFFALLRRPATPESVATGSGSINDSDIGEREPKSGGTGVPDSAVESTCDV